MSKDTLITCPAPLEMLRRGSPVITPDGPGVVCYVDGDAAVVFVDSLGTLKTYHHSALEMDLTDATGRAHAWWWVIAIGRHRLVLEAGLAPLWVSPDRAHIDLSALAFGGFYSLLKYLDPTDDTLLPDGSRVVDALALKAVVEYLIAEGGA